MSDLYDQGITTPFDYVGAIPVEIDGVAINFLVNRDPLYSRLSRVPRGSMSFKVTSDSYRPTYVTMANSGNALSTDLTVVVDDASPLMIGDVLETNNLEAVIVTADPVLTTNTITIARHYGGTSAAAITDATKLYLLGNARSGGENEVKGVSRLPTLTTQNFQTHQFPYQVGGALESATDFALPPGMSSFLGRERAYAMQQCADSIELVTYYGYGSALAASGGRPQATGLRGLITTNKTLSPTNSGSYMPSDFSRDVIQGAFNSGGKVDTAIVSSDFLTGFQKWGIPLTRLVEPGGNTSLGVKIDRFVSPFLNDINIIPAPLLRAGTVIGLSSEEVFMAEKRKMFDKPRGSRGDSYEGDVIAELAVELHNQQHHSWTSGITAFAAQT